jgi:DNA segregation ATPase FtsK/SpoIIIE, S-DNA-T family
MQKKDGYVAFERAARQIRWAETTTLEIRELPNRNDQRSWFGKLVLWLSPLCMVAAFGGYLYFYVLNPNPNSGGGGNPVFSIMLITMGGTALVGFSTQIIRAAKSKRERKAYKARLDKERQRLEIFVAERKKRLLDLNPAPSELINIVNATTYLWERLPRHLDFSEIRVGLARELESGIEFKLPNQVDNALDPGEPEKLTAQLRDDFKYISHIPATINLKQSGAVGIAGAPQIRFALARAIIAQLVTYHSPEDVRLVALYPEIRKDEWFWLGWLPHTRSIKVGAEYPAVGYDPHQQEQQLDWLSKELNEREEKEKPGGLLSGGRGGSEATNVVVLIDDAGQLQDYQTILKHLMARGPKRQIYFIYLTSRVGEIPPTCLASIELKAKGYSLLSKRDETGMGDTTDFQPDQLAVAVCDQLAHMLAPIRLAQQGAATLPPAVDLFGLLKWRGSEVTGDTFLRHWQAKAKTDLRIVLGIGEGGHPLVIDLDESKQGCHGLLVGRSGSGKGELLLDFVTNLAVNNHPERLNLVLGDFKGGATFSVFEDLPHCVGYVTDLEKGGELEIVRVLQSLETELARREHLITSAQKKYGAGVQKIAQYQQMAKDMPPLPYLIVIFDEFGKMKELAPDRVKDLAQIGMRGRSLGVFLLLAMQSPQGLIRGDLDANIRYRIALKVNSTQDSQDVIHDKAASEVITGEIPGRGFFRCDSTLMMFQSARVMGDALSRGGEVAESRPKPFRIGRNWEPVRETQNEDKSHKPEGDTIPDVELVVKAIKEAMTQQPLATPLHRPWLPPLAPHIGMTELLPGSFDSGQRFKGWQTKHPFGWLNVPVAQLDYFWEQRQPLYMADLNKRHLQILGNSNSGRTTSLIATVLGLAATHDPSEIEFLFLDFGFSLKALTGLPHGSLYYSAAEEAERKALLKDLGEELNRRRTKYGKVEKGVVINHLSDFRKYKASRLEAGEEVDNALILVIDNFSYWRRTPEYDQCAAMLRNIIQAGSVYGMHVLLTADKHTDVDYGRYWESFYSVMLQMEQNDLITFPQDKKMLAAWNDKPGRGFVKGDAPRNLVEAQTIFPVAAPEKAQAEATQKIIEAIFHRHKTKPTQELDTAAD